MASTSDKRAYLDYNATSPLRPEARRVMIETMETFGNPSSIHAEGRAARAIVEQARREVADLAGVSPRRVVFVGGGTEAANALLAPDLSAAGRKGPWSRLVMSAGEHPCVLQGHRFAADAAEIAALDSQGRVDMDALRARLEGASAMLALQAANNETGVVQAVADAAEMVHARGGIVVCDAVQIAGRAALNAAWGADALFISGHKLGGPKGVGAWIGVTEGLALGDPWLRGGGQERGARAGTENVVGIAGFGAAARAAKVALTADAQGLLRLRERLESRIREIAPEAVIFGEGAMRLPNTTCFAVPGVPAASLLMRLDIEGVAASSGSACSSGKVAPSHVLAAMGVDPNLALGAIRLSLGWGSSLEDIDRFGEAFAAALGRLRR